MENEFQKFSRILGETLIDESKGIELDPKKVSFICDFQDKHNIPQIFSREMLKFCQMILEKGNKR